MTVMTIDTVPAAPSLNTTESFKGLTSNPVPAMIIVPPFPAKLAVLDATVGGPDWITGIGSPSTVIWAVRAEPVKFALNE